jgi:hypothetical protein
VRGRPIIYDLEQVRSFDFLEGFRDFMKSEGDLAQFLFGPTDTILSGFSAAAKPVPNMRIDLEAGRILKWDQVDADPYGAVAANTDYMYQLGYYPAQELLLSKAQLAAGQSQWVLIRCRFVHVDEIREGDPDGGVHPFYNSSDPRNPLQGINNDGQPLPSVRKGIAEISPLYGTPAATGSETPLPAGAGYVPLYLINLTFGSAPIGNGDILVAGNAAYPGYTPAPIWKGVRAQHHKGIEFGQAPQIDVTQEITGIVPLPNLPGTNTTGLLVCFRSGHGDPNGTVAGNQGDEYLDLDGDSVWVCKTTGSSTTAVWINNNPNSIELVTVFPKTITKSAGTFALKLSTANGVVNLPASGRLKFKSYHNVGYQAILTPAGTDKIWLKDELLNNLPMTRGEAYELEYLPGEGVWLVL